MRISDWSSDVCSSDLNLGVATDGRHVLPAYAPYDPARDGGLKPDFLALTNTLAEFGKDVTPPWSYWQDDSGAGRSEEHTSELQSLMRISYAVFCLKKKITSKLQNTRDNKSLDNRTI